MNWAFLQTNDLMGRQHTQVQTLSPQGSLTIRKRKEDGLKILFNSFVGDSMYYTIKHTIFRTLTIKVKFDDKIYSMNIDKAANDLTTFFISSHETKFFIRKMKYCETMVIEYNTLDGRYQAKFNVSGFEQLLLEKDSYDTLIPKENKWFGWLNK
jgi:hypothetical protein